MKFNMAIKWSGLIVLATLIMTISFSLVSWADTIGKKTKDMASMPPGSPI